MLLIDLRKTVKFILLIITVVYFNPFNHFNKSKAYLTILFHLHVYIYDLLIWGGNPPLPPMAEFVIKKAWTSRFNLRELNFAGNFCHENLFLRFFSKATAKISSREIFYFVKSGIINSAI